VRIPEAPPPPPPPRFDTLETEVLELETTRGATEYVLFGLGQNDRMAPGLRGRLVQDGENIAEIEVEEVYAEGARARLLGSPSQPITPRATVQIDVPRN
jgi:hypothetical protein